MEANLSGATAKWRKAIARILGPFARPVREEPSKGGITIGAHRGYGSRAEIFCIGRVFKQPQAGQHHADRHSILKQLRDIGRRISRRALPNVPIKAQFYGAEEKFTTDEDGYYRIHLRPKIAPPTDVLWHKVDISIEHPRIIRTQADIFIPCEQSRFVVISDIDDTIMKTGVANKFVMLWRLFVQDAASREAFPGVGALYRALYSGSSGRECNPMLYVSRAPWGIYEVIEEFFVRHNIPVGPVLFLREWGISWRNPLPRKAEDHKRDLIRNMLSLYHDLPFVLIGDSGQHDPEVYHKIVAENPNRVLAVYIRNVSRTPDRISQIEKLAAAVADAGSSMVLAADTLAMGEHAVRLELISNETLGEIEGEIASANAQRTIPKTDPLNRPTIEATPGEVVQGGLKEVLQEGSKTPNVVVEQQGREHSPARDG